MTDKDLDLLKKEKKLGTFIKRFEDILSINENTGELSSASDKNPGELSSTANKNPVELSGTVNENTGESSGTSNLRKSDDNNVINILPLLNDISDYLDEAEKYRLKLSAEFEYDRSDFEPGYDIVLIGNVAMAGTFLIAKHNDKKLTSHFSRNFVRSTLGFDRYSHFYIDPDKLKNYGAKAVYLISDGGMNSAIYKLGKDSGHGFRIDYSLVPLLQESVEYCELFDFDPWNILSCGCCLVVCDRGYDFVRKLEKEGILNLMKPTLPSEYFEEGCEMKPEDDMRNFEQIPCRVVGKITKELDKFILHKDVESNINRPEPDDMLKLLKSNLQ